jgi:uncharacterized protein (DUF2252 family)
VAVQIRDLDQTVIGNPAQDLIRLGLSLASAAGCSRRRWRHLAAERLDTVKPIVPLGKKFWALTKAERAGLGRLFEEDAMRIMITGLQSRDDNDAVAVVDAAYWMKGCSSLGRLRYAVMLRVGQGDQSSLCLVDIKEGVTAAAPRSQTAVMPRDNAVRVVSGARALSPNLGDRMIAARLFDKAVVLRELMPQDLKLEVNGLSSGKATALAAYLAGVVGKAHGRQMSREMRAAWLGDLAHARTTALDAPTWLWSSVVSLLGIHEAAYLEHCRRFALAEAA